MKRTYTHYFTMGNQLSTYCTVADSIKHATEQFSGPVVGICIPGYKVVKDEPVKSSDEE